MLIDYITHVEECEVELNPVVGLSYEHIIAREVLLVNEREVGRVDRAGRIGFRDLAAWKTHLCITKFV